MEFLFPIYFKVFSKRVGIHRIRTDLVPAGTETAQGTEPRVLTYPNHHRVMGTLYVPDGVKYIFMAVVLRYWHERTDFSCWEQRPGSARLDFGRVCSAESAMEFKVFS